MGQTRLESVGNTDVGRKRKVNQDSFRIDHEHDVLVVADGMGGHAGGEFASRVCIETIAESIHEDRNSGLSLNANDLAMGAIHRANMVVFNAGKENEVLLGMGTTVDLLLFDDGELLIGHVGDSRVYLLRKNMIWQLTRDHSLVNEKFKIGLITREQMKTDKDKNVITRSVGFESSVLVDIYRRKIEPGDLYLTCSDGLSGMVENDQILQITDEHAFNRDDLQSAVETLIHSANENGGDDNITVILSRAL